MKGKKGTHGEAEEEEQNVANAPRKHALDWILREVERSEKTK